ncbi:MAG: acyl-CoA dehydratase activase [Spirochaetota bacterium]|nr:acyl-CoA dehydratase activase [Spirochaetota bacterium]
MIIGIDAGSKFLKVANQYQGGEIRSQIYREHHGNPEIEISSILNDFTNIKKIIFSGHYAKHLSDQFDNSIVVDEVSAIIAEMKHIKEKYNYIVNVGAGSIKLIELDENGNFYSYKENTLCAAGTGSFLDEQMHRMNFDYETIQSTPFIKNAPDIATRCAVFAKSDMIHRQQEGYTKEEMWSGLCKGVINTMLHTVFMGDIPTERILFCGGLFLNPIVRLWLKKYIRNASFLDNGHYLSAMGSIITFNNYITQGNQTIKGKSIQTDNPGNKENLNTLDTKLSTPVDFSAKREYSANGNEVRIHEEIDNGNKVTIGIDIGSTSNKLVVVNNRDRKVLIDIYRKTEGNPINTTNKLFQEIKDIFKNKQIDITGIATTGSGRKLIGNIIGADLIVNEITAHFKGANYFNSSIETIFEIGGQDSKYIRGYNGAVIDCNMNFVCAAGTGSFIEEQAGRLGFDVREIGDKVIGLRKPHTSDRCTVFMEQDINKLLREGYTKEEVLAGVINSIAKNYINRVVGARPVTGEKIFFQGATARNRGLVAAFEQLLQKEIVVSPYCHVMGAFGASLLSIDKTSGALSQFMGLDVLDQNIKLEYSICDMCSNRCKISHVIFNDGREESWGYMCGKENAEDKKKISDSEDHFKKIFSLLNAKSIPQKSEPAKVGDTKQGTIGIPLSLPMYSYLPLWKTFFQSLGFEVKTSGKSNQNIKETAIQISKADFCFPVKMGLSHFSHITSMEDVDAIFFPTFLSEKKQKNNMPRMLCPFVISFPSLAKNSFSTNKKLISPDIDYRQKESDIVRELCSSLSDYRFNESDIRYALHKGTESHKKFLRARYEKHKSILEEIQNGNKIGIAIIGRPYNLYDNMINLGLPECFNGEDIVVFPYECLINPDDNSSEIHHMYWNYGEKILNISKKIRTMDDVYPVYFTNFSCGPDSFILTRFENIMQGKPYLIIELDEHGSETGYITRIEAFMDVIREKSRKPVLTVNDNERFSFLWTNSEKKRKLWIPPMHQIAGRFFASAFKAWGFDAEALPPEDNDAYELGKKNIRGSECLPACTTIGSFVKKLKDTNADPSKHAFFMPTTEGPCRFGQYNILHRNIMDKNDLQGAEIFSPTSVNSYLGMPDSLRRYLLDVMISSDMLMKYICKIRPYEVNKGEVNLEVENVISKLEKQIEDKKDVIEATQEALKKLSSIPIKDTEKPLVGIVGEIYVRSNSFCNNNLINYIENNHGEAWLAPITEWIIYTAWIEKYFSKLYRKNFLQKLSINIKTGYMFNRMHKFENAVKSYFPNRMEPDIERILEKGKAYLPLVFEGEAILTIGRALVFLEDGADLIVNCAPFGCMPGNITTSIFQNLHKKFDQPIINLFYDGESDINKVVGIYLNNIQKDIPDKMREVS